MNPQHTYVITEHENKVLSCRTFKVVCNFSGLTYMIDQESDHFGIAWYAYPACEGDNAPIGVSALGTIGMRPYSLSDLRVEFVHADLIECEENMINDINGVSVESVLHITPEMIAIYNESDYLK